ncbi:MAG: hypothetical protein OSJ73_27055 [Lachnospiraceae bacterium]|nr:hypothetical protein [Lachnospiraceae bacterium]
MKITYEFVTGEISGVEVDESLGGMLLDLCCCSPGLSQTYSYTLSQTLFEKWVWKYQKYIFNRLTVLLCVFRLVVKAANGVYLALTTSLNTHTLWQRLTN